MDLEVYLLIQEQIYLVLSNYLKFFNNNYLKLHKLNRKLVNLDEICEVDPVDVLFIGPQDLAADLGHLGNHHV